MGLPTILFIPGGWHGPETFDDVRNDLSSRGYDTTVVSLPSVGTTDSNVSLADDTAGVRTMLERLIGEDKDVIVVSHSYGGIPGSNAVQSLNKKDRAARGEKGGVLMFVYMASFAIPAGACLMDGIGGNDLPWWDIKDGLVSPKDTFEVFYADVEPSQAQQVGASLRPMPYRTFWDKSSFEPWEHGFRMGYIFCEDDKAIPLSAQQSMAARFPAGSFTASLAASHSPFLSMPSALGDAIAAAARHVEG